MERSKTDKYAFPGLMQRELPGAALKIVIPDETIEQEKAKPKTKKAEREVDHAEDAPERRPLGKPPAKAKKEAKTAVGKGPDVSKAKVF
jgi:hypothetical protein